jgi:hypothetical protein
MAIQERTKGLGDYAVIPDSAILGSTMQFDTKIREFLLKEEVPR